LSRKKWSDMLVIVKPAYIFFVHIIIWFLQSDLTLFFYITFEYIWLEITLYSNKKLLQDWVIFYLIKK
jgi:hypothetical protein